MADRRQPYKWNEVRAGDIISFRYKSQSTGKKLVQSILVLNPKLNVTLKDGTKKRHLIGIKLEESNRVALRLTDKQITLLETIGDFKKIDDENNLYKLEIDERFILNNVKGVKPRAYDLISKSLILG